MRRFGNLALDLAARLADARARELADALARRARALFPGIRVESDGPRVSLKAQGLGRRTLTDARLRRPGEWLKQE